MGWKVTNIGTGAGETGEWVDRIIASVDDKIGNGDDIIIEEFTHTGFLEKNEFYNPSIDIQLPQDFEGKYNLYVETGTQATIFENGFKDNNQNQAKNQFFVAKSEYAA